MSAVGSARPIKSEITVSKGAFRDYQVTYEVITNDPTDGPLLVLQTDGLPEYFDPYVYENEFDDFSFAETYSAKVREIQKTRRLWEVTVGFYFPRDSKSGGINQRQPQSLNIVNDRQSPLDEPWEISGGFAQFTRPVTRDMNNAAITNNVDEPYIPALEIDDSRKVLVLRKNMPTISLANWSDYSDTVNSGSFWGLSARQIKLTQWRWQMRFFGKGIGYVENEFEFHISYEKDDQGNLIGWTHYVLNEGYREVISNDNDPKKRYSPILIKGQSITKPEKLDANGVRLQHGATPYYNKFEIYREKNFASIGIPNPLPGGVFV